MNTKNEEVDLVALNNKIDALSEQVALLVKAQTFQRELVDEASPILKEVMDAGTIKLADLEERGYFTFGRKALGLVDTVVQNYDEEDLDALGESMVSIIDTVRNLTQSEILTMANDATEVLSHADEVKPVGPMEMLKAGRDEDVQKGLAVMVEILRHIGQASKRTGKGKGGAKRRRLERMVAPRMARKERAPKVAKAEKAAPAAKKVKSKFVPPDLPGVEFDSSGFLADPQQWTPEVGKAIAAALGVEHLAEGHWTAINWARKEYLDSGTSPNIRAITKGSGVTTKELYALFPKSPGKATARCAGIPKPAGCI